MIINSVRGFCMALADSIPGVSGGTIAYILGFYDTFLNSLNNIISQNKKEQKEALIFLIQLLTGWVVAMILSIIILSSLFNKYIYFMSSLLIGLTISSVPLILTEEKNIFNMKPISILKYLFYFILGLALVLFISTSSISASSTTVDLTNLDFKLVLRLMVAGMLAISTMILPGISGSSVLVILKLYIPIINGLKQLISFNLDYFLAIFFFGLGILIGAISTVKIVKYALSNHRASTISFIIGLIIAAIYSIILGPTTLEIPQAPLNFTTFNIAGFILGIFIIGSLNRLKKRKEIL